MMPSGSVQDEKHVFLSVPAPQFLQENLHANTVHMGKDQDVQGPVVRRQGHVGIRKLLDDPDCDQGPDGKRCPEHLRGSPISPNRASSWKMKPQGPIGHPEEGGFLSNDFGESFF